MFLLIKANENSVILYKLFISRPQRVVLQCELLKEKFSALLVYISPHGMSHLKWAAPLLCAHVASVSQLKTGYHVALHNGDVLHSVFSNTVFHR
jgi:hypothetical protein